MRWWYLYSVTARDRERYNKFARFTQITQTDWPTDWLRDKNIKCTPRTDNIIVEMAFVSTRVCAVRCARNVYRNSSFFFLFWIKMWIFLLKKKAQRGGKSEWNADCCWCLFFASFFSNSTKSHANFFPLCTIRIKRFRTFRPNEPLFSAVFLVRNVHTLWYVRMDVYFGTCPDRILKKNLVC